MPVFADDAKPAAPAVSADDIKKALGISFYVQGGYTYNGNASNGATQDSVNDLRVFDHDANSFTLDLAQILISKDTPTPGNVGYRIKLSTGETAKWIHARGLSGAAAQPGPGWRRNRYFRLDRGVCELYVADRQWAQVRSWQDGHLFRR